MKVGDLIVRKTECVSPNDTLAAAEAVMQRENLKVIPVLQDDHVSGLVTGRRIDTQSYATGRRPAQMRVHEAMVNRPMCLRADEDVHEAVHRMEQQQLSELPV